MKVHCLYDKLVSIKDLKSHPKNRNKHPKEQIERLAKILEYQGFRYPIKVSKRSGYVTSGHGRIMAASLNGWKKVPVSFQDYESEEQEYADVQSDNAIASWAELSLDEIKMDLNDLPDLDIDLLGIEDLNIGEDLESAAVEKDFTGLVESEEIDVFKNYIVLLFNDEEKYKKAKNNFKMNEKVFYNSSRTRSDAYKVIGEHRLVFADELF